MSTARMWMQVAAVISVLGATIGLSGCTGGGKDAKEPVETPAAAGKKAAPEATGKAATAAAMPEDTCRVLEKLPGEPPVVLTGKNVVLTRLLKPCVTRDGHKGWQKDTPYLAMGFPCTGGGGRVDYKGHYNAPKMVAFILGTDCGMAPAAGVEVQKLVTDSLQLPNTTKLLAYTPFVVQFWEVDGMSDADTGYTVELRSAPAVEGLWRRFQQGHPVRVRLFGRENTWAQGDAFYFVEADLTMTGHTSFQLAVIQAKSLTKDEVGAVKGRCEALRPKRNCTEVF